ncbi:GPR endopeptidase [Sulfobacillus harzensis]
MAEGNGTWAFEPIQVYTDMAIEARDIVRGDAKEEVPGVRVKETQDQGVVVTEVEIYEEAAEKLMGKPRGHYVTLDVPTFKDRDPDLKRALMAKLTDQLKELLPEDIQGSVLVVGLGNWNATPDALGPRVVERILVTRHLGQVVPDDIKQRMRPVAAVAPGVLGTTGIETLDIIRGIVSEAKPDLVIAIDALAARNLDRLLGSVQIADTGIHPGSGVGNRRQGLTEESLGVPVIAIGVCTVVQSISIAQEAIHQIANQLADDVAFYDILKQMAPTEQRGLIDEVLGSRFSELMVTPKEIDMLIDDMADVLGEALNRALQPRLDASEWA